MQSLSVFQEAALVLAAFSHHKRITTKRLEAAVTAITVYWFTHQRTFKKMVDFVQDAFDAADYYRNPVMVMGDGMIGQMMEPNSEFKEIPTQELPNLKLGRLTVRKAREARTLLTL